MLNNIIIFAIDPGPVLSSYVVWNGISILDHTTTTNEMLRTHLHYSTCSSYILEQIESYGMPVGKSIFDTVFECGRFYEIKPSLILIPRKEVKLHLCHSSRAKDSNIIQALKDRFEPDLLPKQRPKGILKKLVKDQWQAFALAVYYWDTLHTPD